MAAERYFIFIPLHARPEDAERGAADLGGVADLLRGRLRALDPQLSTLPQTSMVVDIFDGVASLLLTDCGPEHLRAVVASGVRYGAMPVSRSADAYIHRDDGSVRSRPGRAA